MIKLTCSVLIASVLSLFLFASAARAGLILDVTYTNGRIVSGPLSFGLTELPAQVSATFELIPIPTPPGVPIPYPNTFRDIDEVLSASFNIGNLFLTTNDLVAFEMNTDANGELENLSYRFEIAGGGIALNFPLTITGIEGIQAFEYIYGTSTYNFAQVPEPASLALFAYGVFGLCWMRRKKVKTVA